MSSRRSRSAGTVDSPRGRGGSSASRTASPATTTHFSLATATREYEAGLACYDRGDLDASVKHLQLALTSLKHQQANSAAYNIDHMLLSNIMLALGNAHGSLGNYNEARSFFQWCHDLIARHEGDGFVGLASPLLNLGILLCKEREYSTALTVLRDAHRLLEGVFGADRALLADTYHNMGVAYEGLNKLPMALQCYAKAIRIREHIPVGAAEPLAQSHNSSMIATTMENVALCWRAQGNHNEAYKLIQKVLQIRRKNPGTGTYEYACALQAAGIIGIDMRKHNFAVTHLEAAWKLFTSLVGPNDKATKHCERLLQHAVGGGEGTRQTQPQQQQQHHHEEQQQQQQHHPVPYGNLQSPSKKNSVHYQQQQISPSTLSGYPMAPLMSTSQPLKTTHMSLPSQPQHNVHPQHDPRGAKMGPSDIFVDPHKFREVPPQQHRGPYEYVRK